MQRVVPEVGIDKIFKFRNYTFAVGVQADADYIDAQLVVERVPGQGRYGPPANDGSTWEMLTRHQTEPNLAIKLTEPERNRFFQEFVSLCNTALTEWANDHDEEIPDVPVEFVEWLRFQILYNVEFDPINIKLVIKG